MGKYLTGSNKTGQKIMQNLSLFSYYLENEGLQNDSSILYRFRWTFENQFGYTSILVKDSNISNVSLIDTDKNSPNPFGRPLGIYNDNSLIQVFKMMLLSIDIQIVGVYSDTF